MNLTQRPQDTRLSVKIAPNGKRGRFTAKWVFDAHLAAAPGPYQNLRLTRVWKFERALVFRP